MNMDKVKARASPAKGEDVQVYETIQDHEDRGKLSYIKMINVGQKMITRNCTGYLPCQISFFLQNVHIHPRKIYRSPSMDAENAELFMQQQESTGRSGRRLTMAGRKYSQDLARFLEGQREVHSECKEMLVLSGASRVHAETLFHLRMVFSCYSTPLLNEMRGGDPWVDARRHRDEVSP